MSRIALVIPTLDHVGGAESEVVLLAKGLARREWKVDVVVLSGAGGLAREELTSAGIRFVSLAMQKGLADLRGWWRFHQWLKRERPEIVHAHLPHATWLARWSRLFAPDCIVIDTIHTSAIGTKGRQFGYRWSDILSDRVTAVSEAAADAYVTAGMVSRDRLVVVANGIDTEAWKPDSQVRRGVRERIGIRDGFLWVSVGRLTHVKDFATLLRAFKTVPERARLVICGGGALEDEVRKLITELEIEERALLLGCVTDVRKWMQAADGFVLASLWEGLPISVLEAMACGAPVVATDVAGTRELIEHGVTGLLAPAKDMERLAGAMTQLMEMLPEERAALAERARQFVCERFDLERVLDQWTALYEQLLYSRAARASLRQSAAK